MFRRPLITPKLFNHSNVKAIKLSCQSRSTVSPFRDQNLRKITSVTRPLAGNSVLAQRRFLCQEVTAANFNSEVLESQQAICFVYYIDNGNCKSYLKVAEKLVDQINAETSEGESIQQDDEPGTNAAEEEEEIQIEGVNAKDNQSSGGKGNNNEKNDQTNKKKKSIHWLKLCQINADENRNLASAFSVERAKLPVTYFIMQGTIIDKINGHVSEKRLSGILYKFLEHYQKETNVDLLTKRNKENEGNENSSPIPSATLTDLTKGASTVFLLNKIYTALVGSEHIRLPEEAEQLDGLKKVIQQTKQKAHEELQGLHKELGLDIRRWSETELISHYYKNPIYISMGLVTALEGLFLARSHAELGDVSRQTVQWAKNDVLQNFEHCLGDKKLKTVMSLLDANLVKGELRMALIMTTQDANRLTGAITAMEGGGANPDHVARMQEMAEFIADQRDYVVSILNIIDENIDTRTPEPEYPAEAVDTLFSNLKETMRVRKQLQNDFNKARKEAVNGDKSSEDFSTKKQEEYKEKGISLVADANDLGQIDTTPKRLFIMQQREQQITAVLMCIIQLFPADPRSQSARSRLSSFLY